ncbi:MerR family transcriptional regulator [Alishewanella longhuensis]|uniref:MerR family transcriptional regulator n=1 Tax=Alishewanella longhuensis TaxID=1091037 RepID=A0ABQ3L3E3_9ALTE|nr:MerR family transcriptional regulator [Alishewanella longhuensis]GHG77621.1 MerR family transcriptional regulator [Alishewanella longhuensis]
MFIGEVVKQTGASAKAVRLYETLGLLGQVQRRGLYRHYSAVQLAQIKLIRQAQQLGFRLSELGAMLPDAGQQPDWSLLLQHLEDKQLDIRRQLSRLQQFDQQLSLMIKEISHCSAAQPQPVLTDCSTLVFTGT